MAMTAAVVASPTVPKVNLLPPEIGEQRKARRTQMLLGSSVLVAAGAVAGLYVLAGTAVSSAEADKATAQSRTTKLQADLRKFSGVRDTYAQVAAQEALLAQAMGGEVRWSSYLNDLSLAMPENVWVTGMTATLASSTATSSGPAPTASGPSLSPSTIGSVELTGYGFQHDDVAVLLEMLAKQKGYAGAYFSNSTLEKPAPGSAGRTTVSFKSSAILTKDALSNRYSKPAGK